MNNEYAVFVPASGFRQGVSPTATANDAVEARNLGGKSDGLSMLAVKQHDPAKSTDYWLPLEYYGDEKTFPIRSQAVTALVNQRRFNKQSKQEQKQ